MNDEITTALTRSGDHLYEQRRVGIYDVAFSGVLPGLD
jgi:hypothetical protein